MLSAFIKLFIFSSFDSFPDRMLVVSIVEKRDVINPVRTAPGELKNAALYFSIIFSTSRNESTTVTPAFATNDRKIPLTLSCLKNTVVSSINGIK